MDTMERLRSYRKQERQLRRKYKGRNVPPKESERIKSLREWVEWYIAGISDPLTRRIAQAYYLEGITWRACGFRHLPGAAEDTPRMMVFRYVLAHPAAEEGERE